MKAGRIFVAIPAMDELESLPLTLHDLAMQEDAPAFEVHICVNQPESYWSLPEKRGICDRNQQTLQYLRQYQGLFLHVLDRASQGQGWPVRRQGVGWARKTLFDNILQTAANDDLIVSLDADTHILPRYLQSVSATMARHPEWPALSVPYYHPLTGEEHQDRAILRYELYMRNYALNLLHIGSPYSFTALGSAIVMRAGALRKIGGITPVQSGEDFYLLQKFRKMAPVGLYNEVPVFPSARLSDRVPFGTGPAVAKGRHGDWESYPLYHHTHFESIAETYRLLPQLYREDVQTDFIVFLQKQFKEMHLWDSIRQNVADYVHFERAFHQKADGLRILQYLRQKHREEPFRDEVALFDNLTLWIPECLPEKYGPERPFNDYSVGELDKMRDLLFELENEWHKN